MNVSEERKNEILEEVVKLFERDEEIDIYLYSYITVNRRGNISLFSDIPFSACDYWVQKLNTKAIDGIKNLEITKLLLEISTDWKELCFELPKPKKGWKSSVLKIGYEPSDTGCEPYIYIDFDDDYFADKYYNRLEAQQQIYDIIAKTQYDIEPDWVADFSKSSTHNYFLYLYYSENKLYYGRSYRAQSHDSRMYMSEKVAKHIIDKELITPELWKQAFC